MRFFISLGQGLIADLAVTRACIIKDTLTNKYLPMYVRIPLFFGGKNWTVLLQTDETTEHEV